MDCYGLSTAAAVFHAYASLQLLCVCFLLFVCVRLCFFFFFFCFPLLLVVKVFNLLNYKNFGMPPKGIER